MIGEGSVGLPCNKNMGRLLKECCCAQTNNNDLILSPMVPPLFLFNVVFFSGRETDKAENGWNIWGPVSYHNFT